MPRKKKIDPPPQPTFPSEVTCKDITYVPILWMETLGYYIGFVKDAETPSDVYAIKCSECDPPMVIPHSSTPT